MATMTRCTFWLLDDFQQVGRDGLAGDRAFHLARPTDDLNADFRILAQAQHQALGALAGSEHVDPLDQDGQLDQPRKADAAIQTSRRSG